MQHMHISLSVAEAVNAFPLLALNKHHNQAFCRNVSHKGRYGGRSRVGGWVNKGDPPTHSLAHFALSSAQLSSCVTHTALTAVVGMPRERERVATPPIPLVSYHPPCERWVSNAKQNWEVTQKGKASGVKTLAADNETCCWGNQQLERDTNWN